jgi:hypothetical protein
MMNKETRRGFLKLGAVMLGSIGIIRYSEPIIDIAHSHEWIEDKGDYVIVRVPDFKSFANEFINKPAIFIMGQNAIVKNLSLKGFANFYIPNGGIITESHFDTRNMTTENIRNPATFKGHGVTLTNCHFDVPSMSPSAINFEAYDQSSKVYLKGCTV